jgi:hypothetical protein
MLWRFSTRNAEPRLRLVNPEPLNLGYYKTLASTIEAPPHNVIILHRQYIVLKGVPDILANDLLQQVVVCPVDHLNRP